MRITPFLAIAVVFAAATVARADVAPDPVVTTGIGAITLAGIALAVVGAVFLVRYVRGRGARK